VSAYARFVEQAEAFVAWLEVLEGEPDVLALQALESLSRLNATALELRSVGVPEGEPEAPRTDQAEFQRIYERAAALPFKHYRFAFDGHELDEDEAFIGDLADDLADIHRDLSEGLWLHRQGHPAAAEWKLHFGFWNHWGQHATQAINALHAWFAYNHGTGPSPRFP
jgi:hypothetical protein